MLHGGNKYSANIIERKIDGNTFDLVDGRKITVHITRKKSDINTKSCMKPLKILKSFHMGNNNQLRTPMGDYFDVFKTPFEVKTTMVKPPRHPIGCIINKIKRKIYTLLFICNRSMKRWPSLCLAVQ